MTKELTLMQIAASPRAGGAETFFVRLMQELSTQSKLVPVARKNSWLAEQLTSSTMAPHTFGFGNLFDFKTKPKLKQLIEDVKPDVVTAWMNRAAGALPRDLNVPTVARLGGYYNLKYYQGIDWLIANTHGIRDYIIDNGWPAERVSYVPNFAPQPPADFKTARDHVRDQYKLPEDAFVVLISGRLHENKGVDVALYALRKLPQRVHFIIAGDGPQRGNLKAAIEADGLVDRVRMTGWMSSVTPLAAAADAWLLPSRHEPLGNSVLDGMMHELPVIATLTDGPKSLIDDGKTGLLIPTDDEKAIVRSVEVLLDDPTLAQSLATAGKAEALAKYSAPVVTAAYMDFYRNVVENHGQ